MKKTLLLLLALAPAALAADLTGRFDANTRYEAPAVHAPANVSRMYARTVARDARLGSLELPAAGGSSMIIWTVPANPTEARVSTRLRTPEGSTLQPRDRGSLERGIRRIPIDDHETRELGVGGGGAQEVLHVMAAAPATYLLEIDMPAEVAGVTVIAAEPDSSLTFATWAAPLSRQPGEPITLHAELRDGDASIRGARVTARLASPSGKSFDVLTLLEQPDGSYTATLAELPESAAGAWQVRFEADGRNASGVRFARTGSGELVAERGAARLGEVRTEVIDGNLRIRTAADVAIAGMYRFDVLAADRAGNAVAWGEGLRELANGATELALDIPLEHLAGTRSDDLFLDVRLLGLDPIGVAGRVTKAPR